MSEGKAQVMERKVERLVCVLTEGLGYVSPEGAQGILDVPLPRTERELWQFLGLSGYYKKIKRKVV